MGMSIGSVRSIIGTAWDAENITPGDVATGITAALLVDSVAALIQVTDQTAHISFDGVAPTAAAGTNIGHEYTAGQTLTVFGAKNLSNFRCIDAVSGSASIVKVTVYK